MISLKYQLPPKFHYTLMTLNLPESPHHLMVEVYSRKTLIKDATGGITRVSPSVPQSLVYDGTPVTRTSMGPTQSVLIRGVLLFWGVV